MVSRTTQEVIQSEQYRIPYHWIPTTTERMWKWPYALEYLCYIKHITEIVHTLGVKTLLDVGCGDGRFIEELPPTVKAQGCDLDSNATRWAQGPVSTTDAA